MFLPSLFYHLAVKIMRRITAMILLIVFATSLLGAQSMQLALDGEAWNDISSYPVKGRQGLLIKQKLSFGDFRTSDVKRSWTRGSSVLTGVGSGTPGQEDYRRIITKEYIDKNQTLFFSLVDTSGNHTQTYCVTDFHARDFYVGDSPVSIVNILADIAGIGDKASNVYYVQIYSGDDQEPWHLFLDNEAAQRSPGDYESRLAKSESEYFRIAPHSMVKNRRGRTAKMPFGSAGFTITDPSGRPVAAVSMIDKGIVYLKDLPPEERVLLASACAALLLQEEI